MKWAGRYLFCWFFLWCFGVVPLCHGREILTPTEEEEYSRPAGTTGQGSPQRPRVPPARPDSPPAGTESQGGDSPEISGPAGAGSGQATSSADSLGDSHRTRQERQGKKKPGKVEETGKPSLSSGPADVSFDPKQMYAAGKPPEKYQPLFDLVGRFCDATKEYFQTSSRGEGPLDRFVGTTDCSLFTSLVFLKLFRIAQNLGFKGPTPIQDEKTQTSQYFKEPPAKALGKGYPPADRSHLKPGDVFVIRNPVKVKVGKEYVTKIKGHVGIFMGYDRSGNVIIAHSTDTTIGAQENPPLVKGNKGVSGARVEVMRTTDSYSQDSSKWQGFFRHPGLEEILDFIHEAGKKPQKPGSVGG